MQIFCDPHFNEICDNPCIWKKKILACILFRICLYNVFWFFFTKCPQGTCTCVDGKLPGSSAGILTRAGRQQHPRTLICPRPQRSWVLTSAVSSEPTGLQVGLDYCTLYTDRHTHTQHNGTTSDTSKSSSMCTCTHTHMDGLRGNQAVASQWPPTKGPLKITRQALTVAVQEKVSLCHCRQLLCAASFKHQILSAVPDWF